MKRFCIAVAGRKGGVGKTTIACGIASVLASQQKKVLIVDLDPQSNAAFVIGANPTKPGTASLISGILPTPLSVNPYMSVLPGGPDLMNHEVQSCDQEELADVLKNYDFEVAIFDCPPGNEHLERLALKAADTALVVANAHPLALMGASRVLHELELNKKRQRQGAKEWMLVQSQIDTRRSMDRKFDSDLQEKFPTLNRFIIRQDVQLSNAAADRVPIMDYEPIGRGATDLKKIASGVLHGTK